MGFFDWLFGKSDEQLEQEIEHSERQLEKDYVQDKPDWRDIIQKGIDARREELDRRRGG